MSVSIGGASPGSPGTRPVKPSVLCVGNYDSDVGYAWWLMEHFWVELARLAEERGQRAFVAFPRLGEISPLLQAAPITPVQLTVPTSPGRGMLELRAFLRQNDVRTVYLTDRAYWSPLYVLFRRWGVRSIIVHDHTPGERPAPPGWKLTAKRARHRLGVGSADLYVGVSRFVRDRSIRVAGLPPHRCAYVHNGLPPAPVAAVDVRAEFGLPANARVIVSSGRTVPYKGIDALIRCAERVTRAEGRTDVYFLHLGSGPGYEQFRAMAREAGVADRFLMPGGRPDVRALLPSCDIALHASRGEAFSLAILEFMAAGLPAIVPDHCGNGEAIRHGVHGILYEPGDVDAAVAWVLRLLDDAGLRHRLGGAAAQRVEEEFSLATMTARFRELVAPHVPVPAGD